MGKRRSVANLNNLLSCDKCPFIDICHELCGDMTKILKESGIAEALRNEVAYDPVKLDHMDFDRGLYHNTVNVESEQFKKSKAIVMSFVMDFVANRMTDKQKELINLYFFQNIKEIPLSELLGITQQAINERKKLALKRLQRYLAKFGLINPIGK